MSVYDSGMTKVVAVTRNGRGDFWLFSSAQEAWRHPLVQYGDAVLESPDDVPRMYNRCFIRGLLERLAQPDLTEEFDLLQSETELRDFYSKKSSRILSLMTRLASEVPEDPAEVIRQIVHDRDHYNDGLTEKKERHMSGETEEKTKKRGAYPEDAVITMGSDSEGNAYGPENNPKRKGSASFDRFALYSDGMTVAQFVDAGGRTADLKYDADKGFISVAA